MKSYIFFLVGFMFFGTSFSHAEVTGLLGWTSVNGNLVLMLPKLKELSSQKTQEKWVSTLSTASTYHSFQKYWVGPERVFDAYPQAGGLTELASFPNGSISLPQDSRSAFRVCMIPNRPHQMSQENSYSKALFQSFLDSGLSPGSIYLVPLGLEVLLKSKPELDRYQSQVSQFCSVLIALGGPDLDPRLYHQQNTASIDTLISRDRTELSLIRKYLELDQGVFYGICRGHQAYAVAVGGELYQDLSLQGAEVTTHRPADSDSKEIQSVWHEIELTDTKNALFEAVGKKKFRVNSRHHQSVKKVPGARVIAWADRQVVEGVEKRDSQGRVRVLTVQFHPEDMGTAESKAVLSWMIKNGENIRLSLKGSKGSGQGQSLK